MFFETRNHPVYNRQQKVAINKKCELSVTSAQLIQNNFSKFKVLVQLENLNSIVFPDSMDIYILCYYNNRLVKANLSRDYPSSMRIRMNSQGLFATYGFDCRKLIFDNNNTNSDSNVSTDYIIPYAKLDRFDVRTDLPNGRWILDSIPITGRISNWELKGLLLMDDGSFSISPHIVGSKCSIADHLLLTTDQPFSPEIEEEAKDIISLLQLAIGSIARPTCRVVRRGSQLLEMVHLSSYQQIPYFWSPLGEIKDGSCGHIRQYIENALPCIIEDKIHKQTVWRGILSTYAIMNMQFIYLEHRLLFIYLILDTLYNEFAAKIDSDAPISDTQRAVFDAKELETDIISVLKKHKIPNSHKKAKIILEHLRRSGRGHGKVPSYEQRITQMFSKFSCECPSSEDLKPRNDIVHEGCLKTHSPTDSLRLMSRMYNAVTRLLFSILRYNGKVSYFPEDKWKAP